MDTAIDMTKPAHQPHFADNMPRASWNNALFLAGTEVAREHGGYLEGALESAAEALSLLNL